MVNLLTEDNLPSLSPGDRRPGSGRDGAWGTWVGQWTAEEGRHGIALRDYLRGHPRRGPDRARARCAWST